MLLDILDASVDEPAVARRSHHTTAPLGPPSLTKDIVMPLHVCHDLQAVDFYVDSSWILMDSLPILGLYLVSILVFQKIHPCEGVYGYSNYPVS